MANGFGQGVTGKAVSERFLRMKKERPWDLSINRDAGGASTPRKKTPKKGPKSEDNDDDEEDLETPSKKKTPLNKVQNGRVAKKKAAASSAGSSFVKNEDFETTYQTYENGFDYNAANYNMAAYEQEQQDDKAAFYQAGIEDADEA